MGESKPCSEVRVVVAVDFGTTFSGFAYALSNDPGQIHTFYEWPMQERGGGKPYCKTQTSLLYKSSSSSSSSDTNKQHSSSSMPSWLRRWRDATAAAAKYKPVKWGWQAQVSYLANLQAQQQQQQQQEEAAGLGLQKMKGKQGRDSEEAPAQCHFVRRFKLLLAPSSSLEDTPKFRPHRDKAGKKLGHEEAAGRSSRRGIFGSWLVKTVACGVRGKRAVVDSDENSKSSSKFVSAGALHLGGTDDDDAEATWAAPSDAAIALPPGVTVDDAVSDYLREMAQLAVTHLQSKYGSHITCSEVQWCLTVPAVWDDSAKQRMLRCAERAGMVDGPGCPPGMAGAASPHPPVVVLESEAASAYCCRLTSRELRFRKGDEFVVADVGGGTVDIVVHRQEDEEGLQLREVAESSGGLCGGAYVDASFLAFLAGRIGPWFRGFAASNPGAVAAILRRWEEVKCSFDGSSGWGSAAMELPRQLAAAWRSREESEEESVKKKKSYDEVEVTAADMELIFEPVVEKVVALIQAQMRPGIKALMVVGGFSASGYLMKRIREAFGKQVQAIINPPEPGSAICQGAVLLGLYPETVVSRICRRTYGVRVLRVFDAAKDPPETMVEEEGQQYRENSFYPFVRRGDAVQVQKKVDRTTLPVSSKSTAMEIEIWSSEQVDPEFTTDPGSVFEGMFEVDMADDSEGLGLKREIRTSMYFGRSCIEVTAQRLNFGDRDEVFRLHHTVHLDSCASEQAAFLDE